MRIPVSTYRLQFTPSFGFKEGRGIIEYLSWLGISDIYASPIFKAKKGSLHGYDVVDPNQLNPEVGAMKDFEELTHEVKRLGMGWIQDFVPNHMAFDTENQMLMHVLENGQGSEYYDFFDIEWNYPFEPSISGRVLAPFLGGLYGETLEKAEIQLRYDEGGFSINYYNLRFPLLIESYADVLTHNHGLKKLKKKLGRFHLDFLKLLGILYILKTLALKEEDSDRADQVLFIKRMLWELYTTNEDVRKVIDEDIRLLNGQKGNPESFGPLDDLLSKQLFRLSFWKVANEEINYRRFFNINELISLKIGEKQVFSSFHLLILGLLRDERFTGLRVDHLDGLYNPMEYLERLREETGDTYLIVEKILNLKEELLSSWPVQGTTGYDFLNHLNELFCERKNKKRFQQIYSELTGLNIPYERLLYEEKRLIIEKNMAGDVDGLARLLKRISIKDRYGSDITLNSIKKAIVELLALFPIYRTYISYKTFNTTDRFYITETIRKARKKEPDLVYEFNFIEKFLLLAFRDSQTDEEKKEWINFTMRFQQLTGPLMAKGLEDTTFYVYNRLLSLNEVGGDPSRFGITAQEFHDFNQKRASVWPYSLSATATHDTKRGEDARARINVLSEIPAEWERNVKLWSKMNKAKKPMVGNINVPDRNDEYFLYQTLIGAFPFDESEKADFTRRLKAYIIKAIREAKVHTAWIEPDTEYENAFASFIEEILVPSEQNPFLKEFLLFHRKVAFYGIFNSLSQTLIKITSPGVPDFYQGTELWDFNFVDPDNRRPVDFEKRKELLKEVISDQLSVGNTVISDQLSVISKDSEKKVISDQVSEEKTVISDQLSVISKDNIYQPASDNSEKLKTDNFELKTSLIDKLLSTKEDGKIKLFLIWRALKARGENKDIFQQGDYLPLNRGGKFKDHIIAFARRAPKDRLDTANSAMANRKNSWAITIAPRFLTSIIKENGYPLGRDVWRDTYLTLPKGSPSLWKDAITGLVIESDQTLRIGDVFKYFPSALLISGKENE
jgi:(1->4)-alpha-D-glucan 1-alpha-D-glucosylmutase